MSYAPSIDATEKKYTPLKELDEKASAWKIEFEAIIQEVLELRKYIRVR